MGNSCGCGEEDEGTPAGGGYNSSITAARRDPRRRDRFARSATNADGTENDPAAAAGDSDGNNSNNIALGTVGGGGNVTTSGSPNNANNLRGTSDSFADTGHNDKYKKYSDAADNDEGGVYQSALHDTEYDSIEARRRGLVDENRGGGSNSSGDNSQETTPREAGAPLPHSGLRQQRPANPNIVAGFISLVGGVPHVVPTPRAGE